MSLTYSIVFEALLSRYGNVGWVHGCLFIFRQVNKEIVHCPSIGRQKLRQKVKKRKYLWRSSSENPHLHTNFRMSYCTQSLSPPTTWPFDEPQNSPNQSTPTNHVVWMSKIVEFLYITTTQKMCYPYNMHLLWGVPYFMSCTMSSTCFFQVNHKLWPTSATFLAALPPIFECRTFGLFEIQ